MSQPNAPTTLAGRVERAGGKMTELEKCLVATLRYAWQELNTIRARDGVAYHRNDGMPYCTEEWWHELTEMCSIAIEAATGEPPKPWPFEWEISTPPSTSGGGDG